MSQSPRPVTSRFMGSILSPLGTRRDRKPGQAGGPRGLTLRLSCRVWSAFVGINLAVSTCVSQEALRTSLAGEAAAATRRQALGQQGGNVKFGRARLFFGGGLGLELNDNVNYSDQLRQEDLIVRPGLNAAGLVPLSEANALFVSLDLSYAKYIYHSEYDRFLIAPGSQLGFDIYVKD